MLLAPSRLFTAPLLSTKSGWQHGLDTLKHEVGWPGWTGLINTEAVIGTIAWYGISLALWALLPAYELEGTELVSGGRLGYRMNCENDPATWKNNQADHDPSILYWRCPHGNMRRRHLGLWPRLRSLDLHQQELRPNFDVQHHHLLRIGRLGVPEVLLGQGPQQGAA